MPRGFSLQALLPPQPTLSDTIGFQLFKLPLTTSTAIQWYLAGGAREPSYMTRRAINLSAEEWATYSDDEQQELIGKQLWMQVPAAFACMRPFTVWSWAACCNTVANYPPPCDFLPGASP